MPNTSAFHRDQVRFASASRRSRTYQAILNGKGGAPYHKNRSSRPYFSSVFQNPEFGNTHYSA